ncbi:MAG: hypothetical protein M3O35_01250 [Acidobacteriota bacterium]|nr:hypothetical protein [Acidobacteriota bacterium]
MDTPKKPSRKKSPDAGPEETKPGVLEAAAQAIGTTLGAIAVKTGIAHPEERKSTPAKVKIPKLVKKDKHRVPRKLKKQMQKQAAAKKG